MSLDYAEERRMIEALKAIGYEQDKLTGGFARGKGAAQSWVSWAQACQMYEAHLEGRVVPRDEIKPESRVIAEHLNEAANDE